jgi:predicted kinase
LFVTEPIFIAAQIYHEAKNVISKGFEVISNSGFLGLSARRSVLRYVKVQTFSAPRS